MSACNNNCVSNDYAIDFAAAVIDLLNLRAGRSYSFKLAFKSRENGAAIDISGDSFQCIIKDASGSVLETLELGSGIEFDAADGVVQVLIGSTTTDNAGKYSHSFIWQIASSGASPVVAEGKIIVKP